MKEIQLTQGYVAIVDDEDYERVSVFIWHARVCIRVDGTVCVYAQRNASKPGGVKTAQSMHRFILDAPKGMQVDHIDGNGLDNSRVNLRVCTHAENLHNQRPQTGRSSKFKGVCWHKRDKKWEAKVKVDGKTKHLGCFTSELDAAHAYDAAAIKHFGEFARTNTYGEDER